MNMDVEMIEEGQIDFLQDDLVCSVCYAEFLDEDDLRVHIKQFHLSVSNLCRFCDLCTRIFCDIEEYAVHLRDTHISILKCCRYCTKLFKCMSEYHEHEKKHNAAALYPKISCSRCIKVFDSKDQIKNHEMKEHSDSNASVIKNFSAVLSSVLCMNIQIFLTAAYGVLPYNCIICDHTTIDVKSYIQHLINRKCRAHTCNECYNVFKHKSKLQAHLKLHVHENIEKNNYIVECGKCKLSITMDSRKSHLKKCNVMCCKLCDLYFNSVEDYNSHRLAKHKRKTISLEVCVYCHRQMVGVDSLNKHVARVHKHNQHLYKYHCTDCKRLFKHPKLLFAHFYSTHKNLHPYTCKICDKTFRIRKGFTLHIKLAHNSIGFVEFNDDFHVFFTDKKPSKQPDVQCHTVNKNPDSNTDQNNDNKNISKDKCQVHDSKIDNGQKLALLQNKSANLKIGTALKDIYIKKSNNGEHNIAEVNVVPNSDTMTNENNDKDNTISTDIEIFERSIEKLLTPSKVKRKYKMVTIQNTDVSSDDSDAPLKTVAKKLKLQTFKKIKSSRALYNKNRTIKGKKFFCKTCNRNCYTHQNYYRHKAIHMTNETKVCIKCYGKFDSMDKLNKHIKEEHSTSQLTETLRKLLEKRKIAESNSKQVTNPKQVVNIDDETTSTEVSTSLSNKKFHNTIKKFNTDRHTTSTNVTMKLVDKGKISVKKFLENFIPENNDIKISIIKDITDAEKIKKQRPLIKLTKFIPDPVHSQQVKLKMPVKFIDDLNEKCDVRIQLTSEYQPPTMKFYNDNENNMTFENYYDTYENYESEESKDIIPEVAQEVMLEGVEEQPSIVHTMNLNNLKKISIAHLSTEAPYFKISNLNLKENSFTLNPEGACSVKQEVLENISLQNGKKLVSVNPLEHLLNKKTIDELRSKTQKNVYYKPRISNVAEAIKNAMEKLDQSPSVKCVKKM